MYHHQSQGTERFLENTMPPPQLAKMSARLITDLKESETGTLYLRELTRRIKNLVLEKELTVLNCPLWDFRKQMSLFCELVRKEKAQGNFVYINLSCKKRKRTFFLY